jgi:hypothetical protein
VAVVGKVVQESLRPETGIAFAVANRVRRQERARPLDDERGQPVTVDPRPEPSSASVTAATWSSSISESHPRTIRV